MSWHLSVHGLGDLLATVSDILEEHGGYQIEPVVARGVFYPDAMRGRDDLETLVVGYVARLPRVRPEVVSRLLLYFLQLLSG